MNFIKLYCSKEERDVLINLDLVESLSGVNHDNKNYICFMFTQGKMPIFYENESERNKAEKLIYNKLFNE